MTNKKYLGNTETKEIHEYSKMTGHCKLNDMKEEHKFWLEFGFEVIITSERKGYNACKWCLSEYHVNND